MVLLYDGAMNDPRIERLGEEHGMAWLAAISTCNTLGRDTLALDELEEALAAHPPTYTLAVRVNAMVEAELAERLPYDHIRMLARLDLWAFDDEADADVVVPMPDE